MMKGYLIERYNHMGDAYVTRRLLEEATEMGVELTLLGAEDCYVTPEGIKNLGIRPDGALLEQRDFVICRYKGDLLKRELATLGHHCFNPLETYDCYLNKFEQVKRLHSTAFRIPRYVMGTKSLAFPVLAKELGLPFVVKGLESSMGREVELIRTADDFAIWKLHAPREKEYLFQEFIKESVGRDMRLYCMRGEIIAAMERVSTGDFRANVALGAQTKALEISEAFQQIGRDLYEETGLDFMGIDLLYGEEQPYFCEINVMPGMEGMEQATGVNVAEKMMKLICETVDATWQKPSNKGGCL